MYSKRCRALRNGNTKSKEKIEKAPLTREDIAQIITVSDVMMKALVSVAFEGCLRPAEYVLAEINQLKNEGECYQLQVVGKTGRRHIYLVDSLPYIKEIKDKDWDLSISKYRKIEYEEVKYEKPEILKKKILELEENIIKGLKGLKI